jgi:hypothetical protein
MRSGGRTRTIRVGCILDAHHKTREPGDIGDLNTPKGREKLIDWGKLHDQAHIVTVSLTEEQAERIRDRLWPGQPLLGATSGCAFFIETPEQVGAINEILQPAISIGFNPSHVWTLQTWPEIVG